MGWTKLLLIGLGLTILGFGAYLFFAPNQAATVFESEEKEEELSELTEDSSPVLPETSSSPPLIEILKEDCDQECANFRESADQYTYCRSICGLSAEPLSPTPQPTDPNLSKDIERKHEAIKESNLSKCETIADPSLRKSCQTRVTEDLLE